MAFFKLHKLRIISRFFNEKKLKVIRMNLAKSKIQIKYNTHFILTQLSFFLVYQLCPINLSSTKLEAICTYNLHKIEEGKTNNTLTHRRITNERKERTWGNETIVCHHHRTIVIVKFVNVRHQTDYTTIAVRNQAQHINPWALQTSATNPRIIQK